MSAYKMGGSHFFQRGGVDPSTLQQDLGTYGSGSYVAKDTRKSHPGNTHSKSKFTKTDVAYMQTNPDKLSIQDLAKKFNISRGYLFRIRKGKIKNYRED